MTQAAVWRDDFAGTGSITVNADGTAYTTVGSNWARTSGTATCTTANAKLVGTIAAQVDKERHLAVTWTTNPSTGFAAGLAFGDITGGNYYKVQVQTSHKYHGYQVVGGVATEKFSGPATGSGAKANDRLDISHTAAGVLTVKVFSALDNAYRLVGTFTDASFAIGNEVALMNGPAGLSIAADDFLAFGTVARPATWIADPAGTVIGDGTLTHPFTYVGAMTAGTLIQGDDSIQLRAGDFGNTTAVAIVPTINGAIDHPIIVERYAPDFTAIPNSWPHVHDNTNLLNGYASYIDFYDIDFGSNDATRDTTLSPKSISTHAVGTRFFNCLIHDYPYDGVGFWEDAAASLFYGCWIYNNGRYDVARSLFGGHGFYTQNNGADTHLILDNAIWNNYNFAVQAYGSSSAVVKDYLIQGNTAFYQATPQSTDPSRQTRELFCGGLTLTVTDQVRMDQNVVWSQWGGNAIQMGYNGTHNIAGSVTDNYAVQNYDNAGTANLLVHYFNSMAVTGNTFVQTKTHGDIAEVQYLTALPTASPWEDNTYYRASSQSFKVNGSGYTTLAQWQGATGYDVVGTTLAATPAPNFVSIRPNQYRNELNVPRAMVTAVIWDGATSVAVDATTILSAGDGYSVWHLFDWVQGNDPLVTGTYAGGSITVPVTAVDPPALVANGTPGTSSYNLGLVTPPAGQPAVFIFVRTASTAPVITPVDTETATGDWVIFPSHNIDAGGMVPGDRYYVCHSADTLPEKYGRQVLGAGIWQGGTVQCYIADAYPDAVGPFYLVKTGFTGCHWTSPYEEPLHHDAVLRAAS